MKNLYKYVFLVAFGIITISCKDDNKHARHNEEVNNQPTVSAPPKPMHVYTKDSISINAYTFEGLEHLLNKKNDTTYVVNFWATWCVPCIEELPYFEKLNAEYKDDKVKVLLVSLDMHKMVESKLIPFMNERKIKSNVVLLRDPDADSWIPKVDSTWSGAIPATLIYNNNSRKFYEKSFTYDELENEVKNFKQ